jgi:osmotically-inducible protein OsmY
MENFMKNYIRIPLETVIASCLLCAPGVFAGPAAQDQPDNTAANKEVHGQTAQDQKQNKADVTITRKIRQALMKDKALSTYAHNVKIITRDGMVTLKGPVRSEDEKKTIGTLAGEAAGGEDKVTNELTVKGE